MLDTLSNVKARLGITTDAYDTFLTTQITLISDVIEAYCRRKFLQAEYVQTFYREDNKATTLMKLFHFPLVEVESIMIDGVEFDAEYYRLNLPSGIIRNLAGVFFTQLETEVTYTAGYATCPTPVLGVLDALVEERYNKKTSGVGLNFGSDVQRISIPGAISIDFDYSLSTNERKSAYGTILGNYANVLDDWRSERAVIGNDKLIYVDDGEPVAEVEQSGFWHTETFTLDAQNITDEFIDLQRVALENSVSVSVQLRAAIIEGEDYDYTVDLDGGVDSKTRITFLNDLVSGGSELEVGDIVQVRYQSEPE